MALPIAAAVGCLALLAIQLGAVPALRYAWGFNLWQYLPAWSSVPLTLGVLFLCWPRGRAQLLAGIRAVPPLQVRRSALVAALVAFVLFWLLRERHFQGDSLILIWAMTTRSGHFLFPDFGATFLWQQSARIGWELGLGALPSAQAFLCAIGAASLPVFWLAARSLAPDRGGVALVAGLMLAGGVLRILAGHIEVYTPLLLATAAYLATAFAYLQRRCHWAWPVLAFGVGLWTHLSYVFLLPSLAALPVLVEPGRPAAWLLRRWLASGLLALAPLLLFFLAMFVATGAGDLETAWQKMRAWSVVGATEGVEVWLRPWGEEGPGTRYRVLSPGHLKYLANAFFLLTPAVAPLALLLLVRAPRRFLATPEARFLAIASAAMILYTLMVRPVYGPYDWDLFSLTAVLLAALVGHVWVNEGPREARDDLGVLLLGATLLFVTIPLLAIGVGPSRVAGPFAIDALQRGEVSDESDREFERLLGPWL